MMKSMPGLPKLVQHLAGYVEVFGTEVESDNKLFPFASFGSNYPYQE